MMWNNSLLKGVWDAYQHYIAWAHDVGFGLWLLTLLGACVVAIMLAVWASGGDEKVKRVEERLWRSTYSS